MSLDDNQVCQYKIDLQVLLRKARIIYKIEEEATFNKVITHTPNLDENTQGRDTTKAVSCIKLCLFGALLRDYLDRIEYLLKD